MAERRTAYLLGAVLLLALALRLPGLDKGPWFDELASISFARDPDFVGRMGHYNQPPLYYGLLRGWIALWGAAEPTLRLFSLPWGLLMVAFVMAWLRPYGTAAACLGGLWAATVPGLARFSVEIRPYAMVLAATAAAFYFTERLVRGGRHGAVGLGLSLALAVATHPVGVFLLPATLVYFLLHPERRGCLDGRRAAAWAVPTALFGVILWALLRPHLRTAGWWMPPLRWNVVDDHLEAALGLQFVPWSWLPWAMAGVAAGVGLAGLSRRTLPFLGATAAYVVPLVAYSLWVLPIFGGRTLLPCLIPVVGFLAVAARSLTARGATVALCGAMACAWATHGAFKPMENWREVFTELERRWKPDDLLVYAQGYLDWQDVDAYFFPIPRENKLIVSPSPRRRLPKTRLQLAGALAARAGRTSGGSVYLLTRGPVEKSLAALFETALGVPEVVVKGGRVRLFKFPDRPWTPRSVYWDVLVRTAPLVPKSGGDLYPEPWEAPRI